MPLQPICRRVSLRACPKPIRSSGSAAFPMAALAPAVTPCCDDAS